MIAEVIVTGASGGIGKSLCRTFLDDGHRVFAISRNQQDYEHKNLKWFQGELHDAPGIEQAILSWSRQSELRILIHNAGFMVRSPFEDTSPENLQTLLNVNLIWPWMLTSKLIHWLNKPGVGHIIYIGSMAGYQGSVKFKGLVGYGASKSAGNSWIEGMASEFAESNMYFNALDLGAVNTKMLKEAIPDYTGGINTATIAGFIKQFALEGFRVMNGVIVPVRIGNP
ncbi:MAG: SDR family oxidoreductase [Bacteroidia bacterium]